MGSICVKGSSCKRNPLAYPMPHAPLIFNAKLHLFYNIATGKNIKIKFNKLHSLFLSNTAGESYADTVMRLPLRAEFTFYYARDCATFRQRSDNVA